MTKNSNYKVFSSASIPMLVSKDSDITQVRKYVCKDSGVKVISNYSNPAPVSPITGNKLIADVSDRQVRKLNAKDFESLYDLGACPKCGSHLYTHASVADFLEDFHCIHCGEEISINTDIEDAEGYYNKMAENVEKVADEKSADVETPITTMIPVTEIDDIVAEVLSELDEEKVEKKEEKVAEEPKVDMEKLCEKVEETKKDNIDDEIKVDMMASIAKLSSFDNIDVIPSGKNTFHYIMADAKPIAKLHKSRAITQVRELFDNPTFLKNALVEALNADGFSKVVASNFGIVPLILKVKTTDAIKAHINDRLNNVKDDSTKQKSDFEESYDQCVAIASVGIIKGMFNSDNTLLKDLSRKFKAMGIEDSENLVKASFEEFGASFLKEIVSKAKELKNKSLEERNEIASSVISYDSTKKVVEVKASTNNYEQEISDLRKDLFNNKRR
jgi:hypothetical protein